MSTATYSRRILKTGRPLGLLDVFSKIAENASAAIRSLYGSLFSSRATDRESRVVEEAAAVRRLADDQRQISPGFACDLYAAADRHELIG